MLFIKKKHFKYKDTGKLKVKMWKKYKIHTLNIGMQYGSISI